MVKKYEFLKHTGDLKFRAYSTSVEGLFENCAVAISSVLSRGKKIKSLIKKDIEVYGKDYESLLYNFIDELIYLFDAEEFVISKAKLSIKEGKLKGVIYGDISSKYKDLDAIKAPTYAEMYVKKQDKKWECQVVLDV